MMGGSIIFMHIVINLLTHYIKMYLLNSET